MPCPWVSGFDFSFETVGDIVSFLLSLKIVQDRLKWLTKRAHNKRSRTAVYACVKSLATPPVACRPKTRDRRSPRAEPSRGALHEKGLVGSLAARPVRVDGQGVVALPGCASHPKGSYVESRSRADIASPRYVFEKHVTVSFTTRFYIFPRRAGYIFYDCFHVLVGFEKCKHVTVSFITCFFSAPGAI